MSISDYRRALKKRRCNYTVRADEQPVGQCDDDDAGQELIPSENRIYVRRIPLIRRR